MVWVTCQGLAAAMGAALVSIPAAGMAQDPNCDWRAVKNDFMLAHFVEALPKVDACIVSLKAQTEAAPPKFNDR